MSDQPHGRPASRPRRGRGGGLSGGGGVSHRVNLSVMMRPASTARTMRPWAADCRLEDRFMRLSSTVIRPRVTAPSVVPMGSGPPAGEGAAAEDHGGDRHEGVVARGVDVAGPVCEASMRPATMMQRRPRSRRRSPGCRRARRPAFSRVGVCEPRARIRTPSAARRVTYQPMTAVATMKTSGAGNAVGTPGRDGRQPVRRRAAGRRQDLQAEPEPDEATCPA